MSFVSRSLHAPLKWSVGISDRSVERSEIVHAEAYRESQRGHTLRVGSESFFSLLLQRQQSAGENGPSMQVEHLHPCSTAVKSFASPQLIWMGWQKQRLCGNGNDRQTEPEMHRC